MFGRGQDYNGNKISPLQFAILILLRSRPMYGYEVLKALRDEFGEFWTPQTGSIYPAIKRLSEHGLLMQESREGTDYYSISPEGAAWVLMTLRNSPRDLRFITRYLDFLGRAGSELLAAEQANRFEESKCTPPRFGDIFESAELDEEERIRRLLKAKDHISQHLAHIDEELKILEAHNKGTREKKGER